ncbi:histidine protein methyltransferase 1 [Perkinsus chesapeaki]|uniref:protein-histidine N-methyltransferase n=1 Tax=Perkinsus chesapeaki TaxID=330153 RepID=A0A7J6MQK7_PERCH|nr:histidine protein methyltransferase 1 [Perkinsus chesapeaki]
MTDPKCRVVATNIASSDTSERISFREVDVTKDLTVEVVSSISGDFDSNVDLKSGFRVWECSIDLAKYVYENLSSEGDIHNLVELGCGHALPGIAALLKSPSAVAYLHDLDPLVLEYITSRNVAKLDESVASRARYVTGPWGRELSTVLGEGGRTFQLILSSEGIYKSSSFEPLLEMVNDLLDPVTGVALFAGKKLYFGCGGGTAPFMRASQVPPADLCRRPSRLRPKHPALNWLRNFIEEKCSEHLTCRSVAVFEDKRSNIREIVEVKKKKQHR